MAENTVWVVIRWWSESEAYKSRHEKPYLRGFTSRKRAKDLNLRNKKYYEAIAEMCLFISRAKGKDSHDPPHIMSYWTNAKILKDIVSNENEFYYKFIQINVSIH